ncbi:MAG: arsenate reductase ArsC [Candidatus Heimdallarchaeota archaeon]|nr:MAG: arsenate reductase ArsC [Candidatus Heimdallarchaeota archaeon]
MYQNSARSQIAEGYLKEKASDKYEVHSAGTEPSLVNPLAVVVMEEIGIDISHYTAKNATQFLYMKMDFDVTVCDNAKEKCPFFLGGRRFIHKGFQDPNAVSNAENDKLKAFREVRDEITSWIDSEFL